MSNPISPESRSIVDHILSDHAANPGHDMACLLCGATYVNAAGHVCDVSTAPAPPETPVRSGEVAAAREALGRLVRRTNRTSIPAQDTDEDVIIHRALNRLELVEKENLERADEIFRRKNQLYELRAQVAELEADAGRWRAVRARATIEQNFPDGWWVSANGKGPAIPTTADEAADWIQSEDAARAASEVRREER